jgi:hypothetical protein
MIFFTNIARKKIIVDENRIEKDTLKYIPPRIGKI